MKKYILLLVVFAFSACRTSKLHTESYHKQDILVGYGSRADLNKIPYKNWFEKNYRSYPADSSTIERLKKHINNFDFKVVMGTWCPDSRKQVPVLFAVLDVAGYTHKQIPILFVPRKYKNYRVAKPFGLKRVPTIIVYQSGKEIGRIIEYPMESLEKDLLKIISGKGYKHELDK